jgi:hypothetical protein
MSQTPKGSKSSPKSEKPRSEKPKSEAKRKESKKGSVSAEGAAASRKNTIKSKSKDGIPNLKDSARGSAKGGGLVDAPVAKAPVNAKFAAAAKKKATQKKLAPPKPHKKLGPIGRFLMNLGIGGYDVHVTNEFAIEAVRALGLQQKHLRRLKKRFDEIDLDGTGTIDTVEFLVRF